MGGDEDDTSHTASDPTSDPAADPASDPAARERQARIDHSPWRPGASATFDRLEPLPFAPEVQDQFDTSTAGRKAEAHLHPRTNRRRTVVLLVAAAAVVAVMSVVATATPGTTPTAGVADIRETSDSTDASDEVGGEMAMEAEAGSAFLASIGAQCAPGRLPIELGTSWLAEVPMAHTLEAPVVVGVSSVVALLAVGDRLAQADGGEVTLYAFDTTDGRPLWSAVDTFLSESTRILGVVDGAVVVGPSLGTLGSDDRLAAFDEATGELLWSRDFRGNWSAEVDATTTEVYVSLRRPAGSSSGVGELLVIDGRTGERRHIAPGSFVAVAPDGRVITRAGDKLLASSPERRDLIGAIDDSESFAIVVDRDREPDEVTSETNAGIDLSVATVGTDETELVLSRPSSAGIDRRRVPMNDPSGRDRPRAVTRLATLGGSAVLGSGAGQTFGAEVGPDTVDIAWSVVGALLRRVPSDRGGTLLMATEGGAAQRVVEAATGRTIAALAVRTGAFSTLGLFANGVVVLDDVDGAPVRSVLDLDGNEMYTIPGSGPLVADHGVLVDVVQESESVRMSGYVDASAADGRVAQACDQSTSNDSPRPSHRDHS